MFQSPSGDSLFSDILNGKIIFAIQCDSFNPLAGIRCFLTRQELAIPKEYFP